MKKTLEQLQAEISEIISDFELPDIKASWEERLSKLGRKIKIYYDCGYSQGSGACFEAESLDFNVIVRSARKYLCKDSLRALKKIRRYNADITVTIKHDGHYCHENSAVVSLSVRNYSCAEINADVLEQSLENWRRDLCLAIYRDLCAAIEYYWSDDAVLDYAVSNGIDVIE